jgi:hypothetical protein
MVPPFARLCKPCEWIGVAESAAGRAEWEAEAEDQAMEAAAVETDRDPAAAVDPDRGYLER